MMPLLLIGSVFQHTHGRRSINNQQYYIIGQKLSHTQLPLPKKTNISNRITSSSNNQLKRLIQLICYMHVCLSPNFYNQNMNIKLITLSLLLILFKETLSSHRNLQFSHHVHGYLPEEFPPEFFLVIDETGNLLDPYIRVGSANLVIGVGSSSRNPIILRAKCLKPLVYVNGACQCPEQGRYIEVNGKKVCASRQGLITEVKQPQCPLLKTRSASEFPVDSLANLLKIFRDYDGANNNEAQPQWGKSFTRLQRRTNSYADNLQQPSDLLPNPRDISNRIGSLNPLEETVNQDGLSMAFIIFGQFIDHDIDLTEAQHPSENRTVQYFNITIPRRDRFFGDQPYFQFTRSQFMENSAPRDFPNMITTWIDGSQIYGSSGALSCLLRSFKNGKMKTSSGDLLPIFDNFFRAGDIRAIENTILASYHTIFIREHNRVCDRVLNEYPSMNDEEIFQIARNYVIALFQKIVYKEFLPLLLGDAYQTQIGQYKGYNPTVNPTLPLEFTTAAFRGHGMLGSSFKKVDESGQELPSVKLRQLFFNQSALFNQNIDNLMRGLSKSPMKQRSPRLIEDLRNLLVLNPQNREIKLDLFSLNVQRGRDHGLGSYNTIREIYNLPKIQYFEDLLPYSEDNLILTDNLAQMYNTPDNIELWVGIMTEKPVSNAILGELGIKLVGQGFRNIRDGDRFWYESQLPPSILRQIEGTSLSDVIRRNSGAKSIPDNIFRVEL